jgi:hypothetical protein
MLVVPRSRNPDKALEARLVAEVHDPEQRGLRASDSQTVDDVEDAQRRRSGTASSAVQGLHPRA